MEVKFKLGFPFNKHPLEGIPAARASSSAGLLDGFYYTASTASATPPLPTDTSAWLKVETILTDASDATYLSDTNASDATNYRHVMLYKASSVTWTDYSIRMAWLGQLAGTLRTSATGAAWSAWHTPLLGDNTGVLTHQTFTNNPADQAGIACCASFRDDVGLVGTPPCELRTVEFVPAFV